MSEYKGIRGFKVQTLSTDPAASVIATGTWASGGSLNSTGEGNRAGAGIQTDALVVGGYSPPGAKLGITEIYDGSTWTEVNDMVVGRSALITFGVSSTAVIAAGGNVYPFTPTNFATAAVESWNGTNWTEVNNLNNGRAAGSATGTQTAGLVFGGGYEPGTPDYGERNYTESWNGTSFSSVSPLNTAKWFGAGAGTQTDALYTGGAPNAAESWNGSSWTAISSINTPRSPLGYGPVGASNTSALVFGGNTPAPANTGATEFWNGTSWSELNDLSTARRNIASAGLATAALAAGGYTTAAVTTTEEWTTSPTAFKPQNLGQVYYNSTSNAFKVTQQSVSAGTWSSGGTMNQGRIAGQMGGTQTDAIFGSGGIPGGVSVNAETYDGSTWTEVNNMSTGRYGGTGFGISTPTTMVVAGIGPGPTVYGVSEAYNGTSWTEVADLNTSRWYLGGASSGTNTDGLVFGGFNVAVTTTYALTESYNGTSWTEVNDLNTSKGYVVGFGTTGSAGSANGYILPATYPSQTETWDGTSWTNTGQNFNTPRSTAGGSAGGSSSSGMVFGGQQPGSIANTEYWDGSTWTELADLAAANEYIVGTGSTVSALGASGDSYTTASEEWTAPTSNSTITVS